MKNIAGDKPDRDQDRSQAASDQPKERNLSDERVYNSEDLFGTLLEITICHNGNLYRLRKTKTGKLILNK